MNAQSILHFINEKLDGVSVTMPEGTYMIFLDCTEYCQQTGKNLDEVLKAGWNVGVGWQDGRKFSYPYESGGAIFKNPGGL